MQPILPMRLTPAMAPFIALIAALSTAPLAAHQPRAQTAVTPAVTPASAPSAVSAAQPINLLSGMPLVQARPPARRAAQIGVPQPGSTKAPTATPMTSQVKSPLAGASSRSSHRLRDRVLHRRHPFHHRHAHGFARDDPARQVSDANAHALAHPQRDAFQNAIQTYAYAEGALYQVFTRPGHITDIMLEPGEQLTGSGPVAAGDTVRWVIGATTSGAGAVARTHILVKPTLDGLATNLIVNTDRRTYHLELTSAAQVAMAAIDWEYPQDLSVAIVAPKRDVVVPLADHAAFGLGSVDHASANNAPADLALASLHFGYTIAGDKPDWRPVQIFDDGVHSYIEFPPTIGESELPRCSSSLRTAPPNWSTVGCRATG